MIKKEMIQNEHREKISQKCALLLKIILGIVSVYFIGVYLYIALSRITYPFDLEWMEGGVVDHVRRILSGKKLYGPPSLEFTPYIYGPLYSYFAALISKIVGVGYVPLRMISFLSSLGSFYLIFKWTTKETQNRFAGFIATAVFAATFRVGGAWFDLARVDSLFLFFLLAGAYLVRFPKNKYSPLYAAILLSLAFLTKQSSLFVCSALALYLLLQNWRSGIIFSLTLLILIGGSTLLLNAIHHGWYSYYIFKLPSEHGWIPQNEWINFWSIDLFSHLPIACLGGILYLSSSWADRRTRFFYFLLAGSFLLTAWLSRLHGGGYDNVLIPAYTILALFSGLLYGTLSSREALKYSLPTLMLLQFSFLTYGPKAQIPTAQDVEAGKQMMQSLQNIPGEVFFVHHGYYSVLSGKKESHAQEGALGDIYRGKNAENRNKLIQEVYLNLSQKRFAAIIVDPGWPIPAGLDEFYIVQRTLFNDPNVFWPVTGARARPQLVYVPK